MVDGGRGNLADAEAFSLITSSGWVVAKETLNLLCLHQPPQSAATDVLYGQLQSENAHARNILVKYLSK